MSARSNSYRHYPHIFSPMQMLYNYTNNIKSSISEFFREYLRPQGKQTLLIFNRYILLAIAVNVDIKLLLFLFTVVYVGLKILKIKPWTNDSAKNLPLSFVNSFYQYKKNTDAQKIFKDQQKSDLQNTSVETNSKQVTQSKSRISILSVQEKQTILKEAHDPQIGQFEPAEIQQSVYHGINEILNSYCQAIWYLKWNSISILWLIVGILYLVEPSSQYDTFKIKTKKDGALEIGGVEKASEIVNHFHLIFVFILVNIILFYVYGTRRLRNQLLLEMYTRQFTYNLIKKRRLQGVKSSLHAEKNLLMKSDKPSTSQLHSPMLFCTKIESRSTASRSRKVNIESLKNFGVSSSEQKQSPKLTLQIQDILSEKKFSPTTDIPDVIQIETPTLEHTKQQSNIQIQQLLERSKVQSEDQIQEQEEYQVPERLLHGSVSDINHRVKEKFQFFSKKYQKPQVGTKELYNRQPETNQKNQNFKVTFPEETNGSNEFKGANNRKKSEQIKPHQVYNDFKISLFKVQKTLKPND